MELKRELLKKYFGLHENVIDMADSAEREITPYLKKIEEIVEYNQLKVIAAMKEARLSDFHLTDSTGYGYNDEGRETIEEIFKAIFKAEDALIRPQIVSGTHAITLCLFGVLRPNDELISVTGTPYDTLRDVIYGKNCGSLADFNIAYSEINLKDGKVDYDTIAKKINNNTKMVLIQRSRGYGLRPSLCINDIQNLIKYIKEIKKDVICLVDNCYGEFTDIQEPVEIGADLCAGSLIKNLGGGIAPTGGYVVGKKDLIQSCAYRLTAPGLGKNCGPTLSTNRLTVQGLFFAPLVVGEALKGATFISKFMELAGFKVFPRYNESRGDIVTAIALGDKRRIINFCRGLQKVGPVDSHVAPEPWDMPGYNHQVIMAGGSFIQGSSIELSADAPIREPFVVFVQGGTNFTHIKLGIMKAYQELLDNP